MADDPDSGASSTCSTTDTPDGTSTVCQRREKILTLEWDKDETWCSEGGPIKGTTQNYDDGDSITINVTDQADASSVTTLNGKVSSNAFGSPWDVIDVLPSGGPSWNPRRKLLGEADGTKTPKPMAVRFVPNVKRDSSDDHECKYNRTNPPKTTPDQVGVTCKFELEVTNYLLTIYGVMKYVRGRGGERIFLNDPSLSAGGFTYDSQTWHFAYMDGTGTFQYWNGTAFVPVPSTWRSSQKNHFGIGFYKSGSSWKARDTGDWPVAWTDWAATDYTGPGNATETKLAFWVTKINERWTDKFDIKRKECRSTKDECCRYQTRGEIDGSDKVTFCRGRSSPVSAVDQPGR